jgi:hypothetical protein
MQFSNRTSAVVYFFKISKCFPDHYIYSLTSHSNEPSGSKRGGEYLEQPSDLHFPKRILFNGRPPTALPSDKPTIIPPVTKSKTNSRKHNNPNRLVLQKFTLQQKCISINVLGRGLLGLAAAADLFEIFKIRNFQILVI